jgi:hypothetical protein
MHVAAKSGSTVSVFQGEWLVVVKMKGLQHLAVTSVLIIRKLGSLFAEVAMIRLAR